MAIRIYITLLVASLTLLALLPNFYDVIGYNMVFAIVGSAIAFGSISALIAARRLYYLAHVTPHTALLAAPLSALVLGAGSGGDWILAIFIVLLFTWVSGYALYKGVNSDVVASLVVSLTASLSVITLYYAQRVIGAGRVTGLILGDPLLVSRIEGYSALVIGVIVAIVSLSITREVFYMGVNREFSMSSGLKVWVYDLMLYTLIGITIASMIRIVGFIVAAVLTLLPGAVALAVARGSIESTIASITIAIIASTLGLILSIALDLSPSGITGLILVLVYIIARLKRIA